MVLFYFIIFEIESLDYIVLVILELAVLKEIGLKLTEIPLALPPRC